MSIASRVTTRRLLGTGAASLALCFGTASIASASDCPGGEGWNKGGSGSYKPGTGAGEKTETDRCEFSLDGTNFYASVKVDDQNLKPGSDGKVHVTVRAAGDATTCTASLASYRTHGPTFATSGQQVFHDFDTVTVKKGQTDTLDTAVPDVGCYAQVDLYRGAVKYDGNYNANDGFEHGDLPAGPDHTVIKDKLIAAWNGGTKDCTEQEIPSSSPTPSATESTPEDTETATETPSETASETTPAEEESESESATPTASESTTEAAATPNGDSGDLAETGANSNTPVIIGGAAALLAAGAGIVLMTRRRKATRA